MGLASEFKSFVLRGNVVDLAVGVIVGAAFGGVVSSLTSDILMPPISWATSGVNFNDWAIELPTTMVDPKLRDKTTEELAGIPADQKYVPVKVAYGKFLQKLFDFLVVAACLFFVIRVTNRLKREEAVSPKEPNATDVLLTQIRDELRQR